MTDRYQRIEHLISRIPSVCAPVASGAYDTGVWWVKFALDINHPLVWNVVQRLAHVINYLSISERFSTVFYPVSPAPEAGQEPRDCLAWIIETTTEDFSPSELAEWLEVRLPNPIEDEAQWKA